ncbi:MAG: tRNA (adenosine(37)-N6)-dimethylallyltransferase MiaA [Candidatus Daviesbacteria bacterium]|nr:tRNA (adenosine(37)-N6)-dimethylallyltransferase MiaA [Candidatus Daviesbacteria bacterium]
MEKVLVIVGPTATGKTDLALKLAKKFNSELVACDSRQVYRGLDIGTGKLPDKKTVPQKYSGFWKINGVIIWLYDLIDLNAQYNVASYIKDATTVIREISSKGKLPIIVGGTGLYLKALLEGLTKINMPVNHSFRKELEKLSLSELQGKLQKISLEKWEQMNSSDRQNPRRLVRSIEVYSMYPYNKTKEKTEGILQNFDVLIVGLYAPRETLYRSVNLRVLAWIKEGILQEVKELINSGVPLQRFGSLGLEYKILADFLERKKNNTDELISTMQGQIRGYVRRQLTWYKKEKNIIWFDVTKKTTFENIEKTVRKWYDTAN